MVADIWGWTKSFAEPKKRIPTWTSPRFTGPSICSKNLGVVTEVAIGDRLHYELIDPSGPHHHMVCRVCNGAYNLSPTYLDEFRDTLLEEFDFEPDLEHFAITGTCSGCRSGQNTPHQH